jgi:hypothetical protein
MSPIRTLEHDELVPDPQVIRELGITAMSLWRWDRDATLLRDGPRRSASETASFAADARLRL